MKKALILNTFRSVKNTLSRFIAIFAIIAIGCGFYAGIKAASPDMKKAAWEYYSKQNLDDIHILSTLGFEEDDISEIKSIFHSEETEAGYTADLYISSGDISRKIVKAYSFAPGKKINLPDIIEGRLPQDPSECAVDYRFYSSDIPAIGEKIILEAPADKELEDTLSRNEYTVVGYVRMPMYIAFERGTTSVGNGVINGYVLIPEENFTTKVYTDVYVSVNGADSKNPFTEKYGGLIDEAKDEYETLGEKRIEIRVQHVTDEAYDEINDAKAEIADAEKEIADGKKELADAEKQLIDGKKELSDAEKKVEDGKKEIADGEKELLDGRKELADAEKELIDGRKEISDAEKELDDGRKELEDGKKEISDAEKELNDGRKEIEDGEKEISDNKQKIADAEKEIADGKKELADAEKEIEDGKKKIKDAEEELEDGIKQYEDGLIEYDEAVDSRDRMLYAVKEIRTVIEKIEADGGEYSESDIDSLLEQIDFIESDANLMQLLKNYMSKHEDDEDKDDRDDDEERSTLEEYLHGLELKIAEIDRQLEDAKKQLEDAKEAIDSGREEIEKNKKLLEDGEKEIEENKKKLSDAEKEVADGKKELSNGEKKLEDAKKELSDGEKKLEDAKKELADGEKELSDGEKKLADAKKELADGERKYYDGKKELEDGERELEDAKKELADGEKEIADAKKELADGEKEIEDNKKKIADAEADIADADKKIADAEKDVEEAVKDAKWYVFGRGDYYPYFSHYGEDCDRVDAIAKVFPIFFILVAALVCWTTMSRMVEEQRIQTGTLKALGYGRFAIMSQYILYALAASIPGALFGLAIGFKLLPSVIFVCYQSMYAQPSIETPFIWSYGIGCTVVACLCTSLSSLYSCRIELGSRPAQLMRAKPPKNGKRIFLERIKFIWNRLEFTHKVTFRNLFRYKSRVLMTVIGVGGCTALLLTGFGLRYSIVSIVDRQYVDIFKYDALAAVDEDKADYDEIEAALKDSGVVSGSLRAMQKERDVYNKDGKTATAYLVVPESTECIDEFFGLHERVSRKELAIEEDGVIINEKLSRVLSVKEGDSIYFNDGYYVTVNGVTENYTFNYVYMSASAYEKAGFENGVKNNIIFMNMTDVSAEDVLSEALVNRDDVMAVTYSAGGGDKFRDLVSSLSLIVVVIILAAGALAFVVMFNLANINVNERVHELATIKVLGFYDGEVAAYIYRENTISAMLGMLAGLFIGIFFERFVILTAEVDAVMFAPDIPFYCFLCAAGMTILFTVLVNVFLYFRLKKIDMAASLKAIE